MRKFLRMIQKTVMQAMLVLIKSYEKEVGN